jgi:predicted nuclease of restriction endonuclease-like RecB superfamily
MNKYAPKNLNKEEAQMLYDGGMSMRKLAKHYGVCINTISDLKLKTRSVKDAMQLHEHKISEQGRNKLSVSAKLRGLGGYRPHPNKGKWYKEIWFDSTWEVTLAQSLDENNILWERPKEGFVWNDNGNKYYPDFYLPEHNVYLDPKNSYLQKIDCEKIEQAQNRNSIKVLVLGKDQLDWNTIALMV